MHASSAIDTALAMGAQQFSLMVGNLDDGIQPSPTYWVLNEGTVQPGYLMVTDSARALELASERIRTEHATADAVAVLTDTYLSNPIGGGRLDALMLRLTIIAADVSMDIALPYQRNEDGTLAFQHDFQLLALSGPLPEDYDGSRMQQVLIASLDRIAAADSMTPSLRKLPAALSDEFFKAATKAQPADKPDAATLLGEVPFIIFALVAGADGTIDRAEVDAFGKHLTALQQTTQLVGKAALVQVQTHGPSVIADVVSREPLRHMARLLAAIQLIDAALGEHAAAEKLALLEMGQAIAGASGGFLGMRSVSPEEARMLKTIASTLGVAVA